MKTIFKGLTLLLMVALFSGCGDESTVVHELCKDVDCHGQGVCDVVDGAALCKCNEGYVNMGPLNCGTPCKTGICGAYGTCIPITIDEYRCETPCNDITCQDNSHCVATSETTTTCNCDEGFERDGENCVAVDKCKDVTCSENSTCNGETGVCDCNEGFEKDGDNCVAVDKCKDVNCTENSTCNTETGVCDCDEGFEKDGETCVAVSNCTKVAITGLKIEPDTTTTLVGVDKDVQDYLLRVNFKAATPAGTYDLANSVYSECKQCAQVTYGPDSSQYFQSAGTLEITRGDGATGESVGSITGLVLNEVTITNGEATVVENGRCLEIDKVSWDTAPPASCTEGVKRCNGNTLQTCSGGVWGGDLDCGSEGKSCNSISLTCEEPAGSCTASGNNDHTTATPMVLDTANSGILCDDERADWYSIELASGAKISMTLSGDIYFDLFILLENGEPAIKQRDPETGTLTYINGEADTRTYLLKVNAGIEEGDFTYSFTPTVTAK